MTTVGSKRSVSLESTSCPPCMQRASIRSRHLHVAAFSKSSRQPALAPCSHAQHKYQHINRFIHRALGFDFGGPDEDEDRSVVKKKKPSRLSNVGTIAASLLIFQNVLKGSVGEAWLAALSITNKYQASNKEVFAAYGKFYSLLLTAGYDTWQDYLLDQVLLGRDNAFARAVAQGGLDRDAPVLRAVAYDLDVLQEIAVPLPALAEYISSVAPTLGPYWVEAASAVATKPPGRMLPSTKSAAIAVNANMPVKYIQRPATAEELSDWRASISGKEAWSNAVPLLQQYYHLHGFGITSRNSTLRWSKGAFEEVAATTTSSSAIPPTSLQSVCAKLAANTVRHCEGLPAQHALIVGPSGSGKSWLLWESTLAAGSDKGLRLVDVSAAEIPNILDIARGCARYPRLRFILVADHLDFPVTKAVAPELSAGLGGSGASGWPTNTLLYVAAAAGSSVSYTDPVVQRFGLVLQTQLLSAEAFGEVVSSLAAAAMAGAGSSSSTGSSSSAGDGRAGAGSGGSDSGSSIVQTLPEAEIAAVVEWAQTHGGRSLRTAATYVQLALSGPQ